MVESLVLLCEQQFPPACHRLFIGHFFLYFDANTLTCTRGTALVEEVVNWLRIHHPFPLRTTHEPTALTTAHDQSIAQILSAITGV